MEAIQKDQLRGWLRKYPWLWAIRNSWESVGFRAERVSTDARDFLLALMGDCQYYLYLETEMGLQVFTSPLNGDGRLANTIIHAAQNERYVKAVAVVRHHPVAPLITIYKPPKDGWQGLFKKSWDLMH